MFFVVALVILLPPIGLSASLTALAWLPDVHQSRAKWRRRARAFGFLSLGSVGLVVFLVYALSHLD
ncbi:MAG TPA: hypothetical protein VMU72_10705 [Gaiellaceae bacterium]|nr:hypothetical protein [Gaiellaceae bacterium]